MATNSLGAKTGNPVVLPVFDIEWTNFPLVITGNGSKGFTATVLKYRQRLNGIEINFSINGNATAAGSGGTALQIQLPSGMLIDYAALGYSAPSSDANDEGYGFEYNITNVGGYTPFAGVIPYSSNTFAFIRFGAGYLVTTNLNTTNSPQLTGRLWLPIQGMSAYQAYGAGLATANRAGLVSCEADGTFTGTFSGLTTSPTQTFAYSRLGKTVTLQLDANLSFTKDGTAGVVTVSGLPAIITPSTTVYASPLPMAYSGSSVSGNVRVQSNGTFVFYRSQAEDSFAASSTATIVKSTITYRLP